MLSSILFAHGTAHSSYPITSLALLRISPTFHKFFPPESNTTHLNNISINQLIDWLYSAHTTHWLSFTFLLKNSSAFWRKPTVTFTSPHFETFIQQVKRYCCNSGHTATSRLAHSFSRFAIVTFSFQRKFLLYDSAHTCKFE